MPPKHSKNNSKDAKKSKEESKKKTIAKHNAAAPIDDPSLIKHPLNDCWSLWYLQNDQRKSWEDMQSKIYTFETVEDFWSIYNHILPPSEVSQGNDYSLFKNNIRPMWEDAANKNGVRWVLSVPTKLRRSKLDDLWLDALLCIMGDNFEFCENVMGAVINVRYGGDRICIWTKDAKNKNSVMAIGDKVKEYLRLSSDFKLHYEAHSSSKNAKPMYYL